MHMTKCPNRGRLVSLYLFMVDKMKATALRLMENKNLKKSNLHLL